MIKLIHYPYGDYEVDAEVDLGEEKNRSLVALGRAVWIGADAAKYDKTPPPTQKKLLQHKLKAQVAKKTAKDTQSFWDRLK